MYFFARYFISVRGWTRSGMVEDHKIILVTFRASITAVVRNTLTPTNRAERKKRRFENTVMANCVYQTY